MRFRGASLPTVHLWMLLWICLALQPLAAQEFQDETSVVVVEVPVHVVRDNKPVSGLTRDDFVLYDGKKRQEILGFEVIDLSVPPTADEPTVDSLSVPLGARRHFLLLFDLTFSAPDSVEKSRRAALDLLRGNDLHPADLVAVATYSQSKGSRLLLGFTPDRRQAEAAVESLGGTNHIARSPDALYLVWGELEGARGQTLAPLFDDPNARPALVQSNSGLDVEINETYRDNALRAEVLDRRNRQTELVTLTRSFGDLAVLLGSVRGRKHVVYFSEGFDTTLLYGTRDEFELARMKRAREEGRVQNVDSSELFGDTRAMASFESMLKELRRADCTVQAVDVGGLGHLNDVQAAGTNLASIDRSFQTGQHDGLSTMAAETGGEFYFNFNDLSDAMQNMLERTGVTYLLTFQPQDIQFDGLYRKLEVKLKKAPRGTRVVHRPGYYAPRKYGHRTAAERQLMTADLILSGQESDGIETRAMAVAFRSERESAYVPLLIEIDGRSLSSAAAGDVLHAGIFAYAIDAKGRVRDFLNHPLGFDMKQGRGELESSGLMFFGHLSLAPGDYTLRVMTRNNRNGIYGLLNVALNVPDYRESPAVLLPAFFAEPDGKWLLAREEEDETVEDYPFEIGGKPFVPAVLPRLEPGLAVPVSLVAYNFGGGKLDVSSRVISSADGRHHARPVLTQIEHSSGESGVDRFVASFDAASLPAGDYVLRVTVSDPGTGEKATSSTPFRVVRAVL